MSTRKVTFLQVNGAGDWAFERGSYQLDGTRGVETGAYAFATNSSLVPITLFSYLLVWKKVNGKWLIHNDCFNVIKPAQG